MNDEELEADAPKVTPDELKRLGAKWIERIRASEKREEKWTEDAAAAEKIYLVDTQSPAREGIADFNILHSNVETIVPAIYNSTPVPDIRDGYGSDEINRIVAQIIERAIQVQIDDNKLDVEIEGSAQDAFMAGRGVVIVRFDADDAADEMGRVSVTGERLEFETVSWRDYREGPAKRWNDVPWVAFRHCIPGEEVERLRDPELKAQLEDGGAKSDEPVLAEGDDDDTYIWEIWDKATKRVLMIVDASQEILNIKSDPLGIPGFFPMSRPVQPITGTGKRTPVCPYSVYKKQAEELNRVSQRIRKITEGLKVRGLIVGDAASLEALSYAEDNQLVPIANLEGLAQTGGLDKAIVWWPIEQAIAVLRELFAARESIKASIYEITGISDIIRGQSDAQETARAQDIKTRWGSIRIKKMQRLIERQVRNTFVISAEIISRHFSPQTLQEMTGIPMPPEVMMAFGTGLNRFRIDVESDSTVRADTSGRREEMAGFLQGTAEFFAAMAPLAQQSPELMGPTVDLYASFARTFNLGRQGEDALEELVSVGKQAAEKAKQAAQEPSPEEKEQELKAKVAEGDLQIKAAGLDLKRGDQDLKRGDQQIKREELTLKEREAEINALALVAETELEDDQQRAVALGDNNV